MFIFEKEKRCLLAIFEKDACWSFMITLICVCVYENRNETCSSCESQILPIEDAHTRSNGPSVIKFFSYQSRNWLPRGPKRIPTGIHYYVIIFQRITSVFMKSRCNSQRRVTHWNEFTSIEINRGKKHVCRTQLCSMYNRLVRLWNFIQCQTRWKFQ